ncbi:DUF6344 domain-containing protein [Streptomyces sp. LE64]|uniref:DUF6344 domain-containing protein n=1 Tax=Streptomyces sp. LE64 TaxID=3448653 RepID=UPI0040412358
MVSNKLAALWTALVAAIVAVLAALGLASPAAATPVVRTEATRHPAPTVREARVPAAAPGRQLRSLPPTMKQRIRAEAHGSSPSCRACTASQDFDAALTEMVNAALADPGLREPAPHRDAQAPSRPLIPAQLPASSPDQAPVSAPANVRGNSGAVPLPRPHGSARQGRHGLVPSGPTGPDAPAVPGPLVAAAS